MKLRLLGVLLAATGLGGCASYDYAGGAAGGYYHGRPSVDHYGGYGAYGGYPAYGYGGYGYGSRYYGGYGYYPYYNSYYPYPRYYIVRPPHGDRGDHHDHDRDPPGDDHPRGERPPPWRRPDGRYVDSGGVMIPGQRNMPRPMVPSQVNPGGSAPPRPAVQQPAPRPQRAERAARSETPAPRPQQRPAGRPMIRAQEN